MASDAELLQCYVASCDETAFAELVDRHLGLVYASALRRTAGRQALAQEIAQSVFTDLARKAHTLQHHPALLGWLYRSTRYAALAAIREDARRHKLAIEIAAMTPSSSDDEPSADWDRLRPLIDETMDQLRERDRTVLLLRFFEGLTFAEIGARMNLAENTARMRTDRALQKLRRHLHSRGLSSSAAALGLALSHAAFASAPSGLAAAVTSTALTSASAAAGYGFAGILLMSKFTTPVISAVGASISAVLLWTSFAPHTAAEELVTLREENSRLTEALASDAPASALATAAAAVESNILGTARAVEQRSSQPRSTGAAASLVLKQATASAAGAAESDSTRHRNRGQATPHDAFMSFAWAAEAGEIQALSKLLWFDREVLPKAEAVLASMPPSLRRDYDTPEKLFALIFAADAIVAPPPAPDLIEGWTVVELAPGRTALRAPGAKPHVDYHQYQQTGDGWKYVVPEVAVQHMPAALTNETLAQAAQR